MSSVAQVYYGKRCVMSTSGDSEQYARESMARVNGLTMLPPADVEVTEDMDESTFTRFMYDESGVPYDDIIKNMVLTDDTDNIRFLFVETETEIDATEEQREYLMLHYKDEVEEKIASLKAEAKNPAEKEGKEEQKQADGEIVTPDKSETVEGEDKGDDTAANSTAKDPSKMHIPDDGFMATATPDKPVGVVVDRSKETVSPLKATGIFNTVHPEQYFMPDISKDIYASFPYLKDLETKITAGGGFKVSYEWASGLLKVKVSPADKPNEILDKYSLTLDLNGYVVTPGAKWWPGINHKTPVDFQKAYKYDLAGIEKYLAGEEIPAELVCFDENVAALNKTVDLRTVFTIAGMTEEDAKAVFGKMKEASKKLTARLNKEYPNARFKLSQYTDKDHFELAATPDVYTNIGGLVANTAGAAAKIQVDGNKNPKLFK